MSQTCNVVMLGVDDIQEYSNNTQIHEEWHIQEIAKSIDNFGFSVPILVDKDYVIIAGHGRLKAAKSLDFVEVPCIIKDDLSPEEVQAFRIGENTVSSYLKWDVHALSDEIGQLKDSKLDFELDSLFASHDEVMEAYYNNVDIDNTPTQFFDEDLEKGRRSNCEGQDNAQIQSEEGEVYDESFDEVKSSESKTEPILKSIKLSLPQKQHQIVLQAIEKAKIMLETDDSNGALYFICNNFVKK